MNNALVKLLRSNVVPICLFPKKTDIQDYDIDFQVIGTGFNIATLSHEALVITASHLSESFEGSFDPNRHERAKLFPEAKNDDIIFDLDESHKGQALHFTCSHYSFYRYTLHRVGLKLPLLLTPLTYVHVGKGQPTTIFLCEPLR